jgi:L-cysteine S-thiosulfotransferase
MKRKNLLTLGLLTSAILAACSSLPSSKELDSLTQKILTDSFESKGQATMDRVVQDEDNRLCTQAKVNGTELDEKTIDAIQERNKQSIKPPSDGQYLGDWKRGEALAQDGRGKTWSDKVTGPVGGNCYNCHQITKEEIAYGTIGPSLYNYGKIRGVTDPKSENAKYMLEYTWNKIYNARATNACSNMPRFGEHKIMTESQMKDLMALLLDPNSPVNK